MSKRLVVALTALLAAVVLAPASSAAPAAPMAATTAAAADPIIIVAGFQSGAEGGLPLSLRIGATGAKTYTTVASRDSGVGSIVDGAKDLGVLVDEVLAETGASKVDLVGLSMGGLTARQYVKFEGGDAKVDTVVTVVTPNHGTNRATLANTFLGCLNIAACVQMAEGSDFLKALNAGDETHGDVTYFTIRTIWDEVVVPIDSVKLAGASANVLVQDQCPFRFVEHQLSALDGTVADGVNDALAGGPIRLNCWAV